ncbi:MAG: hypothetical protein MPW14_16295 [Candidatus Manganitrophus sp.]|nr:hypothetical protein [Candidatus Manganitrophus sp.]WDT78728.1 MAG: hypothetical protein MPW14_16295 [Candidatus Manganitrophus sp.]
MANWRQRGEIEFCGEVYYWSKDREFLKFIDLPRRIFPPVEIALGLAGLDAESRSLLETKGWRLADAHAFTLDPWRYRDYLWASRGSLPSPRIRTSGFGAAGSASGAPVISPPAVR